MKISFFFLFLSLTTFQASAVLSENNLSKITSDQTGGSYELKVISSLSKESTTLHLYIDSDHSASSFETQFKNFNSTTTRSSIPTLAILTMPTSSYQLTKDLTGDALKKIEGSGGADDFFLFISETLIPQISQQTGSTFDHVILHTHGITAAWGAYAMFVRPGLFDTYIFDSPDMSWHKAYPFRAEYAFYKTMQVTLPVKAYFFSIRDDNPNKTSILLQQFEQALKYRGYQDLETHFKIQDQATENALSRTEQLQYVLEDIYQ